MNRFFIDGELYVFAEPQYEYFVCSDGEQFVTSDDQDFYVEQEKD